MNGTAENRDAHVDRAAILANLYARQALRRDALLPLLDIKAEYFRAVEQALWQRHVEEHHAAVRDQIVAELHAKHGRDFRGSVGGLWAIRLLTGKRLNEMFEWDQYC